MKHSNHSHCNAQGALEYLLLIGGAVLIATVVLLVVIGSAGTGETIINDNIDYSQTQVNTAFTGAVGSGGTGGTAAFCGDSAVNGGEACDSSATPSIPAGTTCSNNSIQNYDAGTLSCPSGPTAPACTLVTSGCNNIVPNAFSFSPAYAPVGANNQITLSSLTFPSDTGTSGTAPISGYGIVWFADQVIAGTGLCASLANPAYAAQAQILVAETMSGNYTTYGPLGVNATNSGVIVTNNIPGAIPTTLNALTGTNIPALPAVGNPGTSIDYSFIIGDLGATPVPTCFAVAGYDDDPNLTPIAVSPVYNIQ